MNQLNYLTIILSAVLWSVDIGSVSAQESALRATWMDKTKPDTVRLAALDDLIWDVYLVRQPDSSLILSEEMIDFARSRNLPKWEAAGLRNAGNTLKNQSKFLEAEELFSAALLISERENDTRGIITALGGLGHVHTRLGNHGKASEFYLRGLKLAEEIESMTNVIAFYGELANLYMVQQDTVKSMEMLALGIALSEETGNLQRLMTFKINLAVQHYEFLEYQKSVQVAEEAVSICKELNDNYRLAYARNILAVSLTSLGREKEAFDIHLENLELRMALGDDFGAATTLNHLGIIELNRNNYSSAEDFLLSALALGQKTNSPSVLLRTTAELTKLYEKTDRFKEALEMHRLTVSSKDSLYREENRKELLRQQFQYDYEKREALLTAEQKAKDAIALEKIRRKNAQRNASFIGFGLMLLLALVFFLQRRRIAREKARSEELLLNILPAETAEELKAKGSAEAKLIEHVTVLFTDFKGFTELASHLPAPELVAIIHECFSAFDKICEKYNIEKIKTIGDAYMAAGGLPTPNTTHARDVVLAALEMRDFIANRFSTDSSHSNTLEIRIGIHTGPVVAGIVGIKKFQYDIWGDTVNTASRMESSGEPGKVNISESTYELVKDEFTFKERGEIEAKGKGKMKMYFATLKN